MKEGGKEEKGEEAKLGWAGLSTTISAEPLPVPVSSKSRHGVRRGRAEEPQESRENAVF